MCFFRNKLIGAWARTRDKALLDSLIGKHVVDSLGGGRCNHSSPKRHATEGLNDVMASGAVTIDSGIAVNQMDEGARDAFILTGIGVTRLKESS